MDNGPRVLTRGSDEDLLRDALASADADAAASRPVLRHLLADTGKSLINDEVIARIRGMMRHLARQMLFHLAEAAGHEDRAAFAKPREQAFARAFSRDRAFLAHAHGLTLEAQLTNRLQHRSGIDGVISALIQDAAASGEEDLAQLAMSVVAAQARFLQQQRRMELPLAELPGELFHRVLLVLNAQAGENSGAAEVEARLREEFAEAVSRIGLLARFAMHLGDQSDRALAVEEAGLALFATALATATGQDRDQTIVSFTGDHHARLALALRAAGLKGTALAAQYFQLHPDRAIPAGLDQLSRERAAEILAVAVAEAEA